MVSEIDASEQLFLAALRASIRGEVYTPPGDTKAWSRAVRLAQEHSVLPLLVEAVCASPEREVRCRAWREHAKRLTCAQAQRTADFLLLYAFLAARGLRPAVMKGIVLRALYPQPEQRASTDEDLLIRPEEFPAYREAMLAYGLSPVDPQLDEEKEFEVSYEDKTRGLYIELHKHPFLPESDAYGDMNVLFEGALARSETVRIYGQELWTLAPTDHLLYLLCHAYKHFLHAGFGIRQVCDVGIFAERYAERIDWARVRESCESIHIARFTAAVFRIAERHLGFSMPKAFADLDVDERDLLEDILTGGLYGVNDINRAHSATITLDAVSKQRQGRARAGVLASVFLPLESMAGKYPYLKKYPWLLPAAWVQRVGRYLTHSETRVDPMASVRIGGERVALLREYEIIE